ncbi:MAG: MBL fold metallo-hydrolase [Oscillospiraceae bacterium]|nr:MBL fold metallo-hydrolase [Oscillospiraceae bacterium]
MRLVVFASGSSGNCALVRCGDTNLLLDAGISLRRIKTALYTQGLTVEDLRGVLITHEHSDHVAALRTMAKYHAVPIYAPRTVAVRLCGAMPELEDRLRRIRVDEPFVLGGVTVTAFATPHDTDQSVGYRLESGEEALGCCTDTGHISGEMLSALRGCGTALIEANHDIDMLRFGAYPPALKRRILSERGHLSNDDCARLACMLAGSGTRSLILGHLSRENNTPRRAFETVRAALDAEGFGEVALHVAPVSGELAVEIERCCVSN